MSYSQKEKKEAKDLSLNNGLQSLQDNDFSVDDFKQGIQELQKLDEDEELPFKVQRFCSEYVTHYNEEKAAQKAGWPIWNAATFGRKLLCHPRVQAEIERLQKNITKKLQITQERVLTEWANLAYCNIKDFYDEDGKLIPVHKLDRNVASAIQEVVYDKKGGMKYKLVGKSVALDALSRSLGIFDKDVDRVLPFDLKQFIAMLPQEVQESIKIGLAKRINNGGSSDKK